VDTATAAVDDAAHKTSTAEASTDSPESSAASVGTAGQVASPPPVDEVSIAETVEAITGPTPDALPPAGEPPSPVAPSDPSQSSSTDLILVAQPESGPAAAVVRENPERVSSSNLTPHSSLLDPLSAVRLGPMTSQSPRTRDLARQLALPIHSIEMRQVPLARVIEMLSDMAAVPITLDPAALRMAGMGANEEVSVAARDTTVAAVLADVLAKRGLAYEEQHGLLTVVKPHTDRRRSVDYELKDLVSAGESDVAPLAELLRRFVAPDSWRAAGGTGDIEVDGTTLHVDQSERVQYQVLMFCERLRLARALPTRSRHPAERLTIEPVYPQLESHLAKSTTFTFLPWTRLADVFRDWQDASGVTVLVDWNALADEELGPATPVACSIVDRPWKEALDAILTPLDLNWWAVDAETIQITSRGAGSHVQQIELYPVAKEVLEQHVSTAAFTASLERELASQFAAAAQSEQPYHMALDAPSGRLIVLGPPDVQRYVSSRLTETEPQRHEGHEEE
jgi:hypothetical protein